MMKLLLLFICLLFSIFGCVVNLEESPHATRDQDGYLIAPGDIIVANVGNDSIIWLGPDGRFKGNLYDVDTDANVLLAGLSWDSVGKKILFNYDHLTITALDKTIAIDPIDASIRTVVTNANLNGILPGAARLSGGDYIVAEGTTTIEKFSTGSVRVGAPFLTIATGNSVDLQPLNNGGFLNCVTGTANTVRTYDSAGVVQATATSATPGVTLGAVASSGCVQLPNGNIAVAYSGATDAVRIYDSTLTTVVGTFIDTSYLTTPGKVAGTPEGNVIVTDTAFNHIVEITQAGGFVRTLGGNVLATPTSIMIIPLY
jgi:hypothetical protein